MAAAVLVEVEVQIGRSQRQLRLLRLSGNCGHHGLFGVQRGPKLDRGRGGRRRRRGDKRHGVIADNHYHPSGRSRSHVFHFQHVPLATSARVYRLFGLPEQDAQGQRKKEAGKESREEDKEVDVHLVLPHDDRSERLRLYAVQDQVQLGWFGRLHAFGNEQNQSMSDILDK